MADGSFSANRVTPGVEGPARPVASTGRSRNTIVDEETITGTSKSWQASGLYVKSLGEHWSVGVSFDAESSLYSNIDLGLERRPGRGVQFLPLLPIAPGASSGPSTPWP
ncbi:MAG: hypothetical protein MZW92_62120 [Comamonadaceae bacterium]|nr:hypothetical protein [Comamonadaceae bacterium]